MQQRARSTMYNNINRKQRMSSVEKHHKKESKPETNTKVTILEDTDEEEDDTSVETPPKWTPKEVKKTAITLKITYQISKEEANIHMKHVTLMKYLATELLDVTAIVNKRHEILRLGAVNSMKNEEIYNNHFDLHKVEIGKEKEKQLVTIIQEIQSEQSLAFLKKNTQLITFLKEHRIRLQQHEWRAEEWNTRMIGFLPQLSPTHFSKELATKIFTSKLKGVNDAPRFKLKQITVATTLLNTRIRVQVYGIEVQAQDFYTANRIMVKHTNAPEDFVSFRLQRINVPAFNNAIAYTTQVQAELRTIVINRVSEDSFFILENQVIQLENVIGVYHVTSKESLRIVVDMEAYLTTRKIIKNHLHSWIEMLDPSDTRLTGNPEVASIASDEDSEDNWTHNSYGAESLLSLDISEFKIFHHPSSNVIQTVQQPISDITESSIEEKFQKQQEQIDKQDEKILELTKTIKLMNEDMNAKLEKILQLITNFVRQDKLVTTEQNKTPTIKMDKSTEKRRP